MKKIYILLLTMVTSAVCEVDQTTYEKVWRANRRVNAKNIRVAALLQSGSQPLGTQLTNGDERRYPDKRGSFFKSLKIQNNGLVDVAAFNQMVFALNTNNQNAFNAIPMGTSPVQRRLVDPQAAFAYNLDGGDSWIQTMPPAPALVSAETAGEMVEVYWHALLRDVPFNEYSTDGLAAMAIADLNNLSNFRGPKVNSWVTPGTLFRGNIPGDLMGPLVSQFLYLPVPYGPAGNFGGGVGGTPGIDFQAQIVPSGQMNNDFGTTFADWLPMQRGENPTDTITFTPTRMFIKNARDMGDYVHQDFPTQAYKNAVLIVLNFGSGALDQSNPYLSNPTQEAFVTYNVPDILYLVSVAVEAALRTAWYQKWLVHRRLRPEYFAFLVNQQITGVQNFGLNSDVINSVAVATIFGTFGSYFLPLAYPEGSPTHPSYPAGHAVAAGAAATILKAFFNEDFVIPGPLQPNAANTMLEPYAGTPLTVGNELNKLASNISLGRDYAGVHYRSDGIDGLGLGEKVAIAILENEAYTRNIPFGGFSLTKFDGTKITIGAKKSISKLG